MRILASLEEILEDISGSVNISIIHYPAYNKNGDIIATSMTNLEIHDAARTCMTFGIKLCYIVTPLPRQREIMTKLVHHWEDGYGARYNPKRKEAFSTISFKGSIEEVLDDISSEGKPLLIGTSSKMRPGG
jgi:hypothetical protein